MMLHSINKEASTKYTINLGGTVYTLPFVPTFGNQVSVSYSYPQDIEEATWRVNRNYDAYRDSYRARIHHVSGRQSGKSLVVSDIVNRLRGKVYDMVYIDEMDYTPHANPLDKPIIHRGNLRHRELAKRIERDTRSSVYRRDGIQYDNKDS